MGPIGCDYVNELGREMAWRRRLCYAAGLGALFGCSLPIAHMQDPAQLTAVRIGIAAISYSSLALTLIMRWSFWLPVAVTTVAVASMSAAGTPDLLAYPALVLAMAAFSASSERTPAVVAAVAVGGVLLAGHLAFSLHHAKTGWTDLGVVPWVAAAAAIGQAARGHKAERAMLMERARRAEAGREDEARRRVQQERLRIARELHDAVGHHVALISVQAGAMGYILDTDPAKARESIAHIQQASEAALEELRLTVGLLRQPGDREPVEPAGGVARLDELISSFTATGLQVTCRVTGEVRPLPEATNLTVYRVIQESLTNTAKHAAGAPATIRLAYNPDVLALAVEDDGPVAAGDGEPVAGHGIIGMRERATAVGGWLTAGPRECGGFQVLAELPAPVPAGAAS